MIARAKPAALALILLAPFASAAQAQERPAPVIEVAGGALAFPDDGTVTEGMVGGNARFYLSPRIAVGPEFAYISGDNHSHTMLTGNVTFDVLGPENGRPAPVTPFFVVGGGIFTTREQFPSGDFTSSDGAFTAGGGVRGRVGDRVTVGGEVRVGWELHVRFNGFVGISLGR